MEWYWTVLIIVGYLFGAGVTYGITKKDGIDDFYGCFVLGMIWPLFVPEYLGWKMVKCFYDKLENKN